MQHTPILGASLSSPVLSTANTEDLNCLSEHTHKIPNEIYQQIFDFLIEFDPTWKNHYKFSLLNKQTYTIAYSAPNLLNFLGKKPVDELGLDKNKAVSLLRKYCANAKNVDIDLTDFCDFKAKNKDILHSICTFRTLKIREIDNPGSTLYTSDPSIAQLTQHSSELKSLHLHNSSNLTDAALSKIGSAQLEDLVLNDVLYLTHDGLIKFIKSCPNLRQLTIELRESEDSQSTFSNELLIALADSCENFESLTLSGKAFLIDDSGIDYFAKKLNSKLKSITIHNNQHMTSRSIESLLTHSKNIITLSLMSLLIEISTYHLDQIGSSWSGIKSLHLWNSAPREAVSLNSFAATTHEALETLFLQGFNFSEGMQELLFRNNPNLRNLALNSLGINP